MSIFSDIMEALDKIDIWKRLKTVPDELDAVKARLAAIEAAYGGKHPPDVCKFCGERALRLSAVLGPNAKGKMTENWNCKKCSRTEPRQI